MSLSFHEIQEVALGLADDRKWLEGAVAYGSLARAGQEELGSDLASYYAMNNQSVCLFFAGLAEHGVRPLPGRVRSLKPL